VFDVIAGPYVGRTPRVMRDKLEVWERSSDMALAAHMTVTGRLTTTTVETGRSSARTTSPFRLLRGPVPRVAETYQLRPVDGGTGFTYARRVWVRACGRSAAGGAIASPRPWGRAVAGSLESIAAEAERRAC
jgi:hypothetical protein